MLRHGNTTMRFIISLLLICTLTTTATAHPPVKQDDEAEQLTPEEEHEARGIALRFVQQLRETNDVAPLIDEMFVKDFGERLRHDTEYLPMIFVAPGVIQQASSEELPQFYVAEFNYWVLMIEYIMLQERESQSDESEDTDDSPEEFLPADVLAILKNNPIYAGLIAEEEAAGEEREEQAETDAPAGQEAFRYIKSLADFNDATSTTERAAAALRRYVLPLTMLRHAQREWIEDEDFEEVDDSHLLSFEKDFYGFPTGTRIICAHVEPVHGLEIVVVLVRVEGQLKILTAFPVVGD
jgi:hypothetical protein